LAGKVVILRPFNTTVSPNSIDWYRMDGCCAFGISLKSGQIFQLNTCCLRISSVSSIAYIVIGRSRIIQTLSIIIGMQAI